MPTTEGAPFVPTDPLVELLDNPNPVVFTGDRKSPEAHDRLLHRLQGNILKGHGRDYTVNIFLRFDADATPERIRAELTRLTREYVRSAARQLLESKERREWGVPGRLFGNLFLGRRAYEALGFAADRVSNAFEDPRIKGERPVTTNFVTGMKGAAKGLKDSIDKPAEPLEQAYVDGSLDALLLLADDDQDYLLRISRLEIDRIHEAGAAAVVAVEHGSVLRNEHGQGIEHFGYVDGRSQPLFLATDFDELDQGAVVPGTTKERVADGSGEIKYWNPFARLKLVLLKDPMVDDPWACGSYYVFRKLEQNVKGFTLAEERLAKALKLTKADRARAGAMVVGRFRDGTPLALSKSPGGTARLANDFRYDGVDLLEDGPEGAPLDEHGLKCPFQAHIRKVSPRQENAAKGTLERRIVRRGITYGERPDLDKSSGVTEKPVGGVGLLFACFQRSIMQQFAFTQERWSNTKGFPFRSRPVGQDCVIGHGDRAEQPWRKTYGGAAEKADNFAGFKVDESHPTKFTFESFVTFRGGEFFFAPSLPFLLGDQWADPMDT